MIINKTIYPKTARVGGDEIIITEKLNGNNLVFIHTLTGRKLIATRNQMFDYPANITDLKLSYKGLYNWVQDYGHKLFDNLVMGAAICGEWMTEHIKEYPEYTNTPFVMFAKARVEHTKNDGEFSDETYKLHTFIYDPCLFNYAFIPEGLPNFIVTVPVVERYVGYMPSEEKLNSIYEFYKVIRKPYIMKITRILSPFLQLVEKPIVEGLIIHFRGTISKYVRMKNGKVVEHDPLGRKK